MGYCWYCHWGWSEPVAEIYRQAVEMLGGNEHPLHYGPAHIVWEDENFETCFLRSCIKYFDDWADPHGLTEKELRVVMWSLEQMLALPEEQRCIEPEEYASSGGHPSDFPPRCKTVRV